MKELSIEEKAKAYDLAIEAARCIYNNMKEGSNFSGMEDLEVIFPELAESDDEKIRKALIFHYQGDGCLCTNEYRIDYKDIRAWLENKLKAPQSQWKPSTFHLECVEDAIAMYKERGINSIGLKDILEELKKLREE